MRFRVAAQAVARYRDLLAHELIGYAGLGLQRLEPRFHIADLAKGEAVCGHLQFVGCLGVAYRSAQLPR